MQGPSPSEPDSLGSLLQSALSKQSAVERRDPNTWSDEESNDGADDVVRDCMVGDAEEEVIPDLPPPPISIPPPAQPAAPPQAGRGRGRGRGKKTAAAPAAPVLPPPRSAPIARTRLTKSKNGKLGVIPDHHQADWLPEGYFFGYEPLKFSGGAGPTRLNEKAPTRLMQSVLEEDKKTPLFFFRKFFDDDMIQRVVDKTNGYVEKLATSPEPPPGYSLRGDMQWPPVWVESWIPMTKERIWRWLAMLMWMGLQKKASETELWSTDPFLSRPILSQAFFTRTEHRIIKAALHCQDDDEHEGVLDSDGRPLLKKIGVLYEMARKNWNTHYIPRTDIAYDEITLPMSGRSFLKKQLRGKKIGAGIQALALAESSEDGQYLFDAALDRNTGESGKIQKQLLEVLGHLPKTVKGYRIAADNLFNSVSTCRAVRKLGHGIYGTMRADRGAPIDLIEAGKGLQNQGDWAFMQCPADNMTIIVWNDSAVVYSISNCHPCYATEVERRKKGSVVKVQIQCPVQLAEYNRIMGAIDDFDQLLAFLSVRLRGKKWWHTIFYFIVDAALINGFYLWKWDNQADVDQTEKTRRQWVLDLIKGILDKFGDRAADCRARGDPVSAPVEAQLGGEIRRYFDTGEGQGSGGSHKGLNKATVVLADTKRLEERHFAEMTTKGNCALCYMQHEGAQKQTKYWCPQCRVHLHNHECFNSWHRDAFPVAKPL